MKICYGLIISSKFEQTCRLIDSLNVNGNILVIHVDKKSQEYFNKLKDKYGESPAIFFLSDRIDVKWGDISIVEAEVKMIDFAKKLDFDYFTLMSESCLPLYHDSVIKDFLAKNNGKEFIDVRYDWTKRSRLHLKHEKPYSSFKRKHRNFFAGVEVFTDTLLSWCCKTNKEFKSYKVLTTVQWFTVTKKCLTFFSEYVKEKELVNKYKYTFCSDEHFFAEVIFNSPFYKNLNIPNIRGNNLCYCDWKVINAPKSLTMSDYDKIYHQKVPTLYARKFDMIKNKDIVDKIYQNRDNPNFKIVD